MLNVSFVEAPAMSAVGQILIFTEQQLGSSERPQLVTYLPH
jgi:hypothetical protein